MVKNALRASFLPSSKACSSTFAPFFSSSASIRSASLIASASPASSPSWYIALTSPTPASSSSTGSSIALIAFISETIPLADSGLSQKPASPIFASSSLRLACLVGKSKRVPDRDDPGGKVFDGLAQVLVDHDGEG